MRRRYKQDAVPIYSSVPTRKISATTEISLQKFTGFNFASSAFFSEIASSTDVVDIINSPNYNSMTSRKTEPQSPHMRFIHRERVRQSLAMAGTVALLASGCGYGSNRQQLANRSPAFAVFYRSTQQCRTDLQKQQKHYSTLLQQYQAGTLPTRPLPPMWLFEDCANQAVFYEGTQQCRTDVQRQRGQYSTLLQQHQAGTLPTRPVPPVIQLRDCATLTQNQQPSNSHLRTVTTSEPTTVNSRRSRPVTTQQWNTPDSDARIDIAPESTTSNSPQPQPATTQNRNTPSSTSGAVTAPKPTTASKITTVTSPQRPRVNDKKLGGKKRRSSGRRR